MCEPRFHGLESDVSLLKFHVARIRSDIPEMTSQVRALQAELDRMRCSLDTLRKEVRRDYVPWDVVYRRCERFLNICSLGMAAVMVFALVHRFQ
jgi:hypothetical protein